ncbi:hypothetical protein G9A89_014777 [Geosiphon pyriformis]|nr:hypothetical protein G9A89_014777 [Geosiphon pyriformis]
MATTNQDSSPKSKSLKLFQHETQGEHPCYKEACAIQTCFGKNNFQESKCEDVIQKLGECCEKLLKSGGVSVSCPAKWKRLGACWEHTLSRVKDQRITEKKMYSRKTAFITRSSLSSQCLSYLKGFSIPQYLQKRCLTCSSRSRGGFPSGFLKTKIGRAFRITSSSNLLVIKTIIVGYSLWSLYPPQSYLAYAEENASEDTIEDPDSKLHFPKFITLYDEVQARLIGLGVRTVSFLRVKVYVVGLYIKEQDIGTLRNWTGFDKIKFLSSDDESIADALLDQPVEFAIRIVPVRDTNGQHLRDGFTRSLTQRIQDNSISEEQQKEIIEAITSFKGIFPKSSIKKGSFMLFTKQLDGSLRIEYNVRC